MKKIRLLFLGAAAALLLTSCGTSTPAIAGENGIAVLEQIMLGGVLQWVLIRGVSVHNPILLFLHGGPGTPAIPFEHEMRELEKTFTVVIWDQRGAGKSYNSEIPKQSMNIGQFVSDTHELMQLLLARFNQEKLYLVGHSWGSVLGVLTARKYPELIYAYIGVGQIADMTENERLSHEFTEQKASESGNREAIAELDKIHPPFKGSIKEIMIHRKWLGKFGGVLYGESDFNKIIDMAKASPEYSLGDLLNIEPGSLFTLQCVWDELLTIDFFKQVPALDVPVYFFLGRHDYMTPFTLAEQYFNKLRASQGKQLIWFEKSAHIIILEEPEKFMRLLMTKVLPETRE
jgi:pimeloyl-ACP methyl ester carboxylesterase